MQDINYVYIPFLIAFAVQIFSPYMQNMICIDTWIVPHYLICNGIFILSYFLFGITLWKSREVENDTIFGLTWVLVFLNFLWIYNFKTNKKLALISLFLCLLFGYFVYNSLFLSELSQPNNPLYINLFAIYMVWIGFMITILIESSPEFMTKNRRKEKRRKLRK